MLASVLLMVEGYFFLGAGTSGRIGAESSSYHPENIIVIPAGGSETIFKAKEGAEDQYATAWSALTKFGVNEKDVVIGISASGSAPFVLGGLCIAKAQKISTASISCNLNTKISTFANDAIEVPVGAEFITGSTRLKSGSVQLFITSLIAQAVDSESFCTEIVITNILSQLQQTHCHSQLCSLAMGQIINQSITALEAGGRIIYIGNDVCGRLGVIDASECPPTFGTEPEQVVGVIPQGDKVFQSAFNVSKQEDLEQLLEKLELKKNDSVIMLSSSFHRQLDCYKIAKNCELVGARCSLIQMTNGDVQTDLSNVSTVNLTLECPEEKQREIILKMLLKQAVNMVSSISMIRFGRVIGNRMSHMHSKNQKLQKREIVNLKSLLPLDAYKCGLLLSVSKNTADARQLYNTAKGLRTKQ